MTGHKHLQPPVHGARGEEYHGDLSLHLRGGARGRRLGLGSIITPGGMAGEAEDGRPEDQPHEGHGQQGERSRGQGNSFSRANRMPMIASP